jgi:hypothetical protein
MLAVQRFSATSYQDLQTTLRAYLSLQSSLELDETSLRRLWLEIEKKFTFISPTAAITDEWLSFFTTTIDTSKQSLPKKIFPAFVNYVTSLSCLFIFWKLNTASVTEAFSRRVAVLINKICAKTGQDFDYVAAVNFIDALFLASGAYYDDQVHKYTFLLDEGLTDRQLKIEAFLTKAHAYWIPSFERISAPHSLFVARLFEALLLCSISPPTDDHSTETDDLLINSALPNFTDKRTASILGKLLGWYTPRTQKNVSTFLKNYIHIDGPCSLIALEAALIHLQSSSTIIDGINPYLEAPEEWYSQASEKTSLGAFLELAQKTMGDRITASPLPGTDTNPANELRIDVRLLLPYREASSTFSPVFAGAGAGAGASRVRSVPPVNSILSIPPLPSISNMMKFITADKFKNFCAFIINTSEDYRTSILTQILIEGGNAAAHFEDGNIFRSFPTEDHTSPLFSSEKLEDDPYYPRLFFILVNFLNLVQNEVFKSTILWPLSTLLKTYLLPEQNTIYILNKKTKENILARLKFFVVSHFLFPENIFSTERKNLRKTYLKILLDGKWSPFSPIETALPAQSSDDSITCLLANPRLMVCLSKILEILLDLPLISTQEHRKNAEESYKKTTGTSLASAEKIGLLMRLFNMEESAGRYVITRTLEPKIPNILGLPSSIRKVLYENYKPKARTISDLPFCGAQGQLVDHLAEAITPHLASLLTPKQQAFVLCAYLARHNADANKFWDEYLIGSGPALDRNTYRHYARIYEAAAWNRLRRYYSAKERCQERTQSVFLSILILAILAGLGYVPYFVITEPGDPPFKYGLIVAFYVVCGLLGIAAVVSTLYRNRSFFILKESLAIAMRYNSPYGKYFFSLNTILCLLTGGATTAFSIYKTRLDAATPGSAERNTYANIVLPFLILMLTFGSTAVAALGVSLYIFIQAGFFQRTNPLIGMVDASDSLIRNDAYGAAEDDFETVQVHTTGSTPRGFEPVSNGNNPISGAVIPASSPLGSMYSGLLPNLPSAISSVSSGLGGGTPRADLADAFLAAVTRGGSIAASDADGGVSPFRYTYHPTT